MSAAVAAPPAGEPRQVDEPLDDRVVRLRGTVQNYAWGKLGGASEVGRLAAAAGAPLDERAPYAELWLGTHPGAPATVAEGPHAGRPLAELLAARPEALGAARAAFGGGGGGAPALPFLLKVLSVRTALSIQSHPDKALAERLHAAAPHLYPDDNHKPEMAVALTPFEALCGFAPHADVAAALSGVPELRGLVGDALADAYVRSAEGAPRVAALRAAFSALMAAPDGAAAAAVAALEARLAAEAAAGGALPPPLELAARLARQYPGDVGVLASLLLNRVALAPGQALALAANEPHAYVAGDIVECMAASDNVLRAGLTPKPRDVPALCASLGYGQGAPRPAAPAEFPALHAALYRPPFREFEVWRLAPPGGAAPVALPPAAGPLVALVTAGGGELAGRRVRRGDALFVAAGTPVRVAPGGDGLVAWVAAPNSMGFGVGG